MTELVAATHARLSDGISGQSTKLTVVVDVPAAVLTERESNAWWREAQDIGVEVRSAGLFADATSRYQAPQQRTRRPSVVFVRGLAHRNDLCGIR